MHVLEEGVISQTRHCMFRPNVGEYFHCSPLMCCMCGLGAYTLIYTWVHFQIVCGEVYI